MVDRSFWLLVDHLQPLYGHCYLSGHPQLLLTMLLQANMPKASLRFMLIASFLTCSPAVLLVVCTCCPISQFPSHYGWLIVREGRSSLSVSKHLFILSVSIPAVYHGISCLPCSDSTSSHPCQWPLICIHWLTSLLFFLFLLRGWITPPHSLSSSSFLLFFFFYQHSFF